MVRVIAITGPSAGGKSTLERYVRDTFSFEKYVTATTRKPRDGESHGVNYWFMAREVFNEGVASGLFFEHEEVAGNLYGTPIKSLQEATGPLVLAIDVKGAMTMQERLGSDALVLYVRPPTREENIRRLVGRDGEGAHNDKRIERMKYEWSVEDKFEHVIVNDDLQKAQSAIESVVRSYIK